MLTVHYTDGSTEKYATPEEASEGVGDTILGCDFAVSVESIVCDTELDCDGEPKEYGCTWSLVVEEL